MIENNFATGVLPVFGYKKFTPAVLPVSKYRLFSVVLERV